jgi:hypothetical protein
VTRASDVEDQSEGTVDFTLMYVFHQAFRRDLSRLSTAMDARRTGDPAVRAGWDTFKKQLDVHHSAEDSSLWPHTPITVCHADGSHRQQTKGSRHATHHLRCDR